MPTVAVVDGAKIQFFAEEHPPPHFHVAYAEHRAQISIEPLRLLRGHLPPAKLANVLSWAATRRMALREAWDAMEAKRRPERIR